MSAVRILLGIICITAVYRGDVPDGGVIGMERMKEFLSVMRPEVVPSKAQLERRNQFAVLANSLIGVREGKKENTGTEVTKYLNYTGIYVPAPWCAAMVCWVFKLAGYAAPKTAWSPALFPSDRLARDALKGNVIGIYFPELKRIGHCGIIVGAKDDLIYSVEGNTNVTGSREGDGVYKKIRHKRTISKISDWIGEDQQ